MFRKKVVQMTPTVVVCLAKLDGRSECFKTAALGGITPNSPILTQHHRTQGSSSPLNPFIAEMDSLEAVRDWLLVLSKNDAEPVRQGRRGSRQ
jgi:hypothetical protein